MNVGLVIDPIFSKHVSPQPHPENPQRLQAIYDQLHAEKLLSRCTRIPTRVANDDELALVHTDEYLFKLRNCSQSSYTQLDGDTYCCADSYRVASTAVGATLNALSALHYDQLDSAFALIRPPGHHARPSSAMGFCLLNNIAIAARYALTALGLKRVAIIDFDLHHGNGTEEVFYEDNQVLFISTHQYPLYPGSGAMTDLGKKKGFGYNLNFPLPADLPENDLLLLYDQVIVPTVERFAPDIILVSAGFDAHLEDPLGRLRLTNFGFKSIVNSIESLRNNINDLKTLYLLEGGYNLTTLAASSAAVIDELCSDKKSIRDLKPLTKFIQNLMHQYPPNVREMWGLSDI